ncbi:hypothetical protein GIS00_21320 [Nakamurella sp. YIM 132087]|uniref:Bacterial Ig-like domain-containing protein n=1 Tax=Nakamurella alba TaxID=2665158 RepID=A0A7K1FQQ8_9ACTN|nr:Ig-like domain-containing protein [Nakamurella alba]MTD16481.1 hypothetical protein [Nakamurella alba]
MTVLSLLAGMLVALPAGAPPVLPAGDLTGDGTADAIEYVTTDFENCLIVITPADTAGAFAGRTFEHEATGFGDCDYDYFLKGLGQVRDDGSWQLFFDGYLVGELSTLRRTADDFVVETAPRSTQAPVDLTVTDADGDGRDDTVTETSDLASQAFASTVDGSGRFVSSVEVASFPSTTVLTPDDASINYGQPAGILVETTEVIIGFTPTGTTEVFVDGTFVTDVQAPEEFPGVSAVHVDLPLLAPGSHTVEARYLGDTQVLPSRGTTTIRVGQATTTTALTITPSSPLAGSPTKVSVSVRPTPAQGGPATGLVVVLIDWRQPKVLRLAAGKASTTLVLARGRHQVQVAYAGDAFRTASATTRVVTVR